MTQPDSDEREVACSCACHGNVFRHPEGYEECATCGCKLEDPDPDAVGCDLGCGAPITEASVSLPLSLAQRILAELEAHRGMWSKAIAAELRAVMERK